MRPSWHETHAVKRTQRQDRGPCRPRRRPHPRHHVGLARPPTHGETSATKDMLEPTVKVLTGFLRSTDDVSTGLKIEAGFPFPGPAGGLGHARRQTRAAGSSSEPGAPTVLWAATEMPPLLYLTPSDGAWVPASHIKKTIVSSSHRNEPSPPSGNQTGYSKRRLNGSLPRQVWLLPPRFRRYPQQLRESGPRAAEY